MLCMSMRENMKNMVVLWEHCFPHSFAFVGISAVEVMRVVSPAPRSFRPLEPVERIVLLDMLVRVAVERLGLGIFLIARKTRKKK